MMALYEAMGCIQRPGVMRQGNGAGPISTAGWMGEMMKH